MKTKLVGLAVWIVAALQAVPSWAAAHIDATTRNHSVSAETVLIAEDGAAKLPIVISEKGSKDTKARAAELASYLERLTGAKFTVKTGTGGPGILMGTIVEFPTPSAAEGLKIYDVYDGRDAYAIRTEGGCVKLLGATDLGVSHAMSRFLEWFGCRWFFSGPTWEVIPKISKLSFNLNETDRPEVLGMDFGYNMGQQYEKTDPDAGEATNAWNRMNRIAQGFESGAGHCAHNVVARFPKEFEAHPEMRALIKDEDGNLVRTGTGPETPPGQPLKPGSKSWGMWGQLCVTNPETVKLVIRYAEEWLDQHLNADMVGVGPDDGGEWCLCPECAKLGNVGNQAFYLANQVARAIQKSHPGKLAGLLAYNWHCDPPDFPLEPNVYVELTTTMLDNTKYGFDGLLALWPTKVKYVGLYDYWAVYDWTRDDMPSGRTSDTQYVAEKLPYYIKHGLICMRAECGNSWGSQGLSYYLAAHVMWNTSVDTEALKADFYEKAFGPAAKEMKAYYEHVDARYKPLVGPSFYRVCLDDLEAAEKAAAGNPDALARIEQLKEYNVYVYMLHKKNDRALKPEERKKWALETLRWNYRIRNTYMTFWTFFAGFTTAQWAKEFNEPTWDWYETNQKHEADRMPYRDVSPVTAEETDRWFQQMKGDYGEVPKVTQVNFSKRLVATEWSVKEGPSEPTLVLHDRYSVALASFQGEPLRFTINHGTFYKNKPNGAYVLEGMDGKEIARGETHHGENRLELNVPAAGVYYLRYDDHLAGSNFTPAKGLGAAFVPEGARGHTGEMRTWFYVPKNTAEIQFYASLWQVRPGIRIRNPAGQWIGADGRPVPEGKDGCVIKPDGSYRIIPVEKGMDGAIWTLVTPTCAEGPFHFQFFNIPTILSLSPDAVLVPEEVAERDGLTIRR